MSISKGLWCKIKPGILFLAMLSRLCVPFIMVFRFLISTGPFLLLSAKCERLSFSTIFFPCYFPFFFRNRESIMEHFWWDTIILKKTHLISQNSVHAYLHVMNYYPIEWILQKGHLKWLSRQVFDSHDPFHEIQLSHKPSLMAEMPTSHETALANHKMSPERLMINPTQNPSYDTRKERRCSTTKVISDN